MRYLWDTCGILWDCNGISWDSIANEYPESNGDFMGLHGFYNRIVKRGKVGFLPHEMVDFPTTNWVQWSG
jgi:hypothetical protein